MESFVTRQNVSMKSHAASPSPRRMSAAETGVNHRGGHPSTAGGLRAARSLGKEVFNGTGSPHFLRAWDHERMFEGHPDRECGEHRTTGQRAWCYGCSEWCYPEEPCKGCELPQLRALITEMRAKSCGCLGGLGSDA